MGKAEEVKALQEQLQQLQQEIRDAEMKAQQVEGQLQTSKTKRQQLEAKSDNETIQQSEKTPQSTPKLGTEWATAQLQDL
ncbi:hypothetical protein PENSTE_c019G09587 [Penicillium steckii]|uniref:Uncharacterized protein n=1 Tax=Penicillium steckii TaxID=303698 RepID=A0A1V6SVY8_9EURO|nr:hypothetical protein PENSTE_c019G09587 [Penicillium steckii]